MNTQNSTQNATQNSAQEAAQLIEEIIKSDNTASLFSPDGTAALREQIGSNTRLTKLTANTQSLASSIAPHARALPSWQTYPERWQVVLVILEELRTRSSPRHAQRKESEEEEEEGEESVQDNQPDQTAENEEEREEEEEGEEDEDLGVSEKQVRQLLDAVKDEFSYVTELAEVWKHLGKRTIVGRVADLSVAVSGKTIAFLQALRRKIRDAFDYLGLKGILVTTSRLMRKSRGFKVLVKLTGTVLVVLIFLVVVIGYPLYRLIKNPLRFLKWLFEDVDIEIPEPE